MKYCVLIIDGAAGWPMAKEGKKTSLELARTPNLDALAKESMLGMTTTVPEGWEPSSACACMSILGYDPKIYYKGRSGIEAQSMGIKYGPGEVVFRCNLVAIRDGIMWDYSAGHITTPEAKELVAALEKNLGSDEVQFFPGVSYRHILKIKNHEDTLQAVCTPPHDISDKPIARSLPKGPGSEFLLDLMKRSEPILRNHPVSLRRMVTGQAPAHMIWLFWGSGQVPSLPSYDKSYGIQAAMTSGVDLLKGLATMAKMDILKIKGVTDGSDNDYVAQAEGAIAALKDHDLVVIHIEAPDEAGHAGSVKEKVKAIEDTDEKVVSRLMAYKDDELRLLVMPDHPTPIKIKTHTGEPVPFMLCGPGFKSNGAKRFVEAEAKKTDFIIDSGYDIIKKLIKT